MKVILFRYEKEKINFLECDITSWNLVLWDKEKIHLISTYSKWEKYKKILDELLQIKIRYWADYFIYQSPQKYRWMIKDEEWFVNSSIMHLFCYQNNINILELTPSVVREKLWMNNKDFKSLLMDSTDELVHKYNISKSDKLFEWLLLLSHIKNTI